jgi:hypothetical protein
MLCPVKLVNTYAPLDNELATCNVSSIDEQFDDLEGNGGNEE